MNYTYLIIFAILNLYLMLILAIYNLYLILIINQVNQVKIIHIKLDTSIINVSDCYDMCYYNKSYCIEFYDKDNGMEYSCGRGENILFNDTLNEGQYATDGDMCICLYDIKLINTNPFLNIQL